MSGSPYMIPTNEWDHQELKVDSPPNEKPITQYEIARTKRSIRRKTREKQEMVYRGIVSAVIGSLLLAAAVIAYFLTTIPTQGFVGMSLIGCAAVFGCLRICGVYFHFSDVRELNNKITADKKGLTQRGIHVD